ncbi:cation-translocating P-type ATPase [Ramlibacter montanisoli]|uniref:cation-translocating P-type ATPase n=1 Tax=Ramlibacter montanisoli TaxID=2732512 RepID=UPI00209C34BC|nr:cation-translocating P-type ATPase [Ramlibacter montanisoli]
MAPARGRRGRARARRGHPPRPRPRGGAGARRSPRTQRAARSPAAQPGRAGGGAVQGPDDRRADRRRAALGRAGRLGRHDRDRHHHRAQRHHRRGAGLAGGPRAGRAAQAGGGAGRGGARRQHAQGRGARAGARRRRAAGSRQPGARRPAPDRGRATAGGRIGADRRIGDRRQADRGPVRRAARARRPPEHGLQGHHGHAGRGRGLVVAIGPSTELGKMAGLLAEGGWEPTPLQRRLGVFGKRLAVAVLVVCAIVFVVGLMRGEPPLLMLLTAVSLAVAGIPEALPAVITVLLALGARRMVEFNALVRRLASVETLGSVTWVCSDKTGTLTQNRMRAEVAVHAQGLTWHAGEAAPAASELLRAAALCNDAQPAPGGGWQGDPTETSLAELAAAAGLQHEALDAELPRVGEQPFDSVLKRMTTYHQAADGVVAYTKGAPEAVVPLCEAAWHAEGPRPLDAGEWTRQAEALAAQGLRVLALARRDFARVPDDDTPASEVEGRLQLLGLVGLIDPPRAEAAASVRECLQAGIAVAMITGDHPATARAIALRLGIVSDAHATVLTGAQLAKLDDATLAARARQVRVYARVDPAQKIRIVQALQSQGELVAMTGDGVNDAPALQRADIGVAMGRGGTDVAREASSLVLLDDNFATIAAAVREGRRIYDNIRKFVRYAMTGNSAEIGVIFLAPLVGLPLPLLPIHILWVNLVTDGLPGLALAAEPAEEGVMQRPPRPPTESLFARGLWQHVLLVGLLLTGLCLGVQAWALRSGNMHWQTMVFTVLTLGQMAHVLAIRSEATPLWRLGLRSNLPLLLAVLLTFLLQLATIYLPVLNPVFRTEPLSLGELAICLAAASLVWVAVELEKAWRRRHAPARLQPA